MAEEVRLPGFRPVASPTRTLPRTRQFHFTPLPAPRAPAPAPQPPRVAPPPPSRHPLQDLGESLLSVSDKLQPILKRLNEARREREAAEADALALRQNMTSWAKAVEADPSLADRSPWFQQVYRERLGQNAIQALGNQLYAEYHQSPLAGSTDPNAVQGWLSERLQGVFRELQDDPHALQGASAASAKLAQSFIELHQKNAVANLNAKNADDFEIAIGTLIDNEYEAAAAERREVDYEAIMRGLHREEARARMQGMPGHTINDLVAKTIATKMDYHLDQGLGAVALANRPDGTPGAGRTQAGMAAITAAENRVHARLIEEENRRYTLQQRAKAQAADAAYSAVVTQLLEQHKAGQPLAISPDTLQAAARVDPDLVTKLNSVVNALRSQSEHEDLGAVAPLYLGVYTGQLGQPDLARAVAAGLIRKTDTLRHLAEQAAQNERSPILSSSDVRDAMQNVVRAVAGGDALTGLFKNPERAVRVSNDFRESVAKWAQENPGASPMERQEFLTRLSNHYLDYYRKLDGLDAEQEPLPPRLGEAQQTPPAPSPAAPEKPAPTEPAPLPSKEPHLTPRADLQWQRVPAFADAGTLETAFRSWLEGEDDGLFGQWIIALGFSEPAQVVEFYETQKKLLANKR